MGFALSAPTYTLPSASIASLRVCHFRPPYPSGVLWEYGSTLQRKSHLCIPFLGIARTQSQFPHSCVCERFIYSQDRSTYFPAAE
jgi:hypothetical protein